MVGWSDGLRVLALLLVTLPLTFAMNDPGHDTLYVVKDGDSNISGSITLTGTTTAGDVRYARLLYGDLLDIRANGSIQSVTSRPAIQASTNSLYLDGNGNVNINTVGGTTSVVQIGDRVTQEITLNVSGTIRQQGITVCLSNGTNCPGTLSGSNVSGSGTTNALAKWTSSGAIGNSILVEDEMNIGINTPTPGQTLDVRGTTLLNSSGASLQVINSTTTHLYLNGTTGRIGIGTRTPHSTLDVAGDVNASGNLYDNGNRVCTSTNGLCTGGAAGYTQWRLGSNSGSTAAVTNDTVVNLTGGTMITTSLSDTTLTISNSYGASIDASELASTTGSGAVVLNESPVITGSGTLVASTIRVGSNHVCQSTGTNCPTMLTGANITGSGIANYLSKWADADTLVNSVIYDDGTSVGIGTTTPNAKLHISENSDTSESWLTIQDTDTTVGSQIPAIIFRNNSNVIGRLRATDTLGRQLGGGENNTHVTVSPTGSVGFGTSNPLTNLHIHDSNADSTFGTVFVNKTFASNRPLLYALQSAAGGNSGDDQGLLLDVTGVAQGTAVHIKNAGTSRVVVLNNGNVGVGTAAPSVQLEVNGTNAAQSIRKSGTSYGDYLSFQVSTGTVGAINRNDTHGLTLRSSSNEPLGIWQTAAQPIILLTNNTERLRVTPAGNVGIGTTAPDAVLLVNASGVTTAIVAQQGRDTSEVLTVRNSSGHDVWLLTLQGAQNNRPTVYDGATGTLQASASFYGGKMGVGTSSPTAKLHVSSTDAELLRVQNATATHLFINGSTGHTGIGTSSPARTVHVNDTLRLQPRSTAPTDASLGDLYVDSDTNTLCFYNSTGWIGAAGTGTCV